MERKDRCQETAVWFSPITFWKCSTKGSIAMGFWKHFVSSATSSMRGAKRADVWLNRMTGISAVFSWVLRKSRKDNPHSASRSWLKTITFTDFVFRMKQEAKLATVENIVTALCFGAGALLVVLALHTLSTVKTVNADGMSGYGIKSAFASFEKRDVIGAGTFPGTLTESDNTSTVPGAGAMSFRPTVSAGTDTAAGNQAPLSNVERRSADAPRKSVGSVAVARSVVGVSGTGNNSGGRFPSEIRSGRPCQKDGGAGRSHVAA